MGVLLDFLGESVVVLFDGDERGLNKVVWTDDAWIMKELLFLEQ